MPTRGDDAAQIANEPRNGRLDDDPEQGLHFPFSSTATFLRPRAVAYRESRIPTLGPSQQGSSGQCFLNNSPGTSITRDNLASDDATDARRASDSSERTLYDQTEEEMQRSLKRVSLSSYQHPNDIPSPSNVYFSGGPPRSTVKYRFGHGPSLDDSDHQSHSREDDDILPNDLGHEAPLHSGVVSNLLELHRVSKSTSKWENYECSPSRSGSLSESGPDIRPRLSRLYSLGGYDADDPRITGATRELLDDRVDLERNVKDQMGLRSMSYKQRRKEAQKIKIRFFVTCMSISLRRHHVLL